MSSDNKTSADFTRHVDFRHCKALKMYDEKKCSVVHDFRDKSRRESGNVY